MRHTFSQKNAKSEYINNTIWTDKFQQIFGIVDFGGKRNRQAANEWTAAMMRRIRTPPRLRDVDLLAAERRNGIAWGVSPRTWYGIGLLAAERRHLSTSHGVAAPRLEYRFRIHSRG